MFRMRFLSRSTAAAITGVTLAAAGLTVATISAVPAAASTAITITSGGCSGGGSTFCYSPESATATVGTPVTWTNMSGIAHTVTSCTSAACAGAPANTGSDTFNVSIGAANGSSGSFTFTHAGTYTYFCTIHGFAAMHGTIIVTGASTSSPPAAATPTPSASSSPSSSSPAAPSTGAASGLTGLIGLLIAAAGLLTALLAIGIRRRR
ncbi:MAG TPA: plastocyanin/azurin family copper-binding protein [Candidatus Dormibacteraeota bacterium]